MSFGGVDVEGYSTYYNDEVDGGGYASFKSQKYKRRKTGRKSVRRGLISMFDTGKVCLDLTCRPLKGFTQNMLNSKYINDLIVAF